MTEEERDADMIRALSRSQKAEQAYANLSQQDGEFRQYVENFAAMLPILNVRNVRAQLGHGAFRQYNRAELLVAIDRSKIKSAPRKWQPGTMPTWPELLEAIYMVRCNLFHGAKSFEDDRDQSLVRVSDQILRHFIAKTHCFDWTH